MNPPLAWSLDAYVALLYVNPPLAWSLDSGCLCADVAVLYVNPPLAWILDPGCLCSTSLCESPTGLDFGFWMLM